MTRQMLSFPTLHPRPRRKLVATILVAAMLVAANPRAVSAKQPGEAEPQRLFRNGERLYHLDVGRLEGVWSAVAHREGSASVTLHALRDGLASPLEPDLLSADGGSVDPFAWEQVITWSVSASATGLDSTLASGNDRVTTRFPWSLMDAPATFEEVEETIEIEVNGRLIQLGTDQLARLRQTLESGATLRDEELPPELHLLAAGFDDLPSFINSVHALYLLEAGVRGAPGGPGLVDDNSAQGCTAICLGCAGSALLSLGAYFALVASCGSALVTGGATAIACIAAFIGVQGTHFAVLGSCGRCYDCTHRPAS